MSYPSDRDGKSKTASAVDQEHYPEQHEVDMAPSEDGSPLSHRKIAQRAFELWQARGCPWGSPEQDWLEAETELQAEAAEHPAAHGMAHMAGSVQR